MKRSQMVDATTLVVPRLQYSVNHTRRKNGKRTEPFVGFYIEKRKYVELDEVLAAAGVETMTTVHPREGRAAEEVESWSLGEQVELYPVTAGPPATTVEACLRQFSEQTADAGIGLFWPRGERSKGAFRGYLYLGPDRPAPMVQLVARSTMTDHLIAALVTHTRVCQVADNLIDRNRHPDPVYLHEIRLPLRAREDSVSAGKGETSEIIPYACGHPALEQIDAAYLRKVWRSEEIHRRAVTDYDAVVNWAFEYRAGALGSE